MAARRGHGVASDVQNVALAQFSLDDTGRGAFEYLVNEGDVKAIAVTDGAKAGLLAAARHAWNAAGFSVRGAEECQQGHDSLTSGTVLLVDGAQMIGLKELERLLAVADKARAKVALIADADQLLAMRVESPFQEMLRLAGQR
jgi:hypothetical protein